MSALVFTRWNGQLHSSLEHDGPSKEPRLGSEVLRIELSPVEATVPLEMLARKYGRRLEAI